MANPSGKARKAPVSSESGLASRALREKAVTQTLASSKLERGVHSDRFTKNLGRYVEGEITPAELRDLSR
ncbi:hypothetical protein [Agrococcus sp. ARC_14]|uniref:antitoxin VbhA family protein n=1 Tax=Agrococcus sp. ARC_14 TaxID=2919927 RepID=UPI001F0540A3|nr:hypothetical protein [Agrococcus sp. ARC_14]MCH1883043.1 hypothetical protein [Agrococcus sp. ARC_14]